MLARMTRRVREPRARRESDMHACQMTDTYFGTVQDARDEWDDKAIDKYAGLAATGVVDNNSCNCLACKVSDRLFCAYGWVLLRCAE
jgi:hypothetical protein